MITERTIRFHRPMVLLGASCLKCSGKFIRRTTLIYKQRVWDSGKFWLSQVEKSKLFSQEYLPPWKLNVSLLLHFGESQTIKGTFSVIFTSQRMNEYEWIYDWTLMLLKDFREPLLLSFELIYFGNFFCHRAENSWGIICKILGRVGPLGRNINFSVSLGITESLGFSELSVYTKVVLLKTYS